MSGKTQIYRLVNPWIKGLVETTVTAKNPIKAAKKIYKNLSQHMTNIVEDYEIVIWNTETDKLFRFKITEKKVKSENGEDDDIDFTIELIDKPLPKEVEKKLIENITRLDKEDDSDSDSDFSDSDSFSMGMRMDRRSLEGKIMTQNIIDKYTYFYLPYHYPKTNYITFNVKETTDKKPTDIKISNDDINVKFSSFPTVYIPSFVYPNAPISTVRFDLWPYMV